MTTNWVQGDGSAQSLERLAHLFVLRSLHDLGFWIKVRAFARARDDTLVERCLVPELEVLFYEARVITNTIPAVTPVFATNVVFSNLMTSAASGTLASIEMGREVEYYAEAVQVIRGEYENPMGTEPLDALINAMFARLGLVHSILRRVERREWASIERIAAASVESEYHALRGIAESLAMDSPTRLSILNNQDFVTAGEAARQIRENPLPEQ